MINPNPNKSLRHIHILTPGMIYQNTKDIHEASKIGARLKKEQEGLDARTVKGAEPVSTTGGMTTDEVLGLLMSRGEADTKKEREKKALEDAIQKAEKEKAKARRKSQRAAREG